MLRGGGDFSVWLDALQFFLRKQNLKGDWPYTKASPSPYPYYTVLTMESIKFLPKSLNVVLVCNRYLAPRFLTLTRTSDTFDSLRFNGDSLWGHAWWSAHSEIVLKYIFVPTATGGRCLRDLLATASVEELGHLQDYDDMCTAMITQLLLAITDADPSQKLEKKRELLRWIVKHGFYASALHWQGIDHECQGCLKEPTLAPMAKQILEHMGYEIEEPIDEDPQPILEEDPIAATG